MAVRGEAVRGAHRSQGALCNGRRRCLYLLQDESLSNLSLQRVFEHFVEGGDCVHLFLPFRTRSLQPLCDATEAIRTESLEDLYVGIE